jgi:hypothetical protein
MTNICNAATNINTYSDPSSPPASQSTSELGPTVIREILHETGYPARIEETDAGWKITSSSNGTSFVIRLGSYDEDSDCYRRILAGAKYESDCDIAWAIKKMNVFNQSHCHLKGFVEDDGRLTITMNYLLGEHVSSAQVEQWILLWKAGITLFEHYWSEALAE